MGALVEKHYYGWCSGSFQRSWLRRKNSAGVTTLLLIVAAFVTSGAHGELPRERKNQIDECVVLLHGLGRSSLSMKGIEWSLRANHYLVENMDYASFQYPIEVLAQQAVGGGIHSCVERGATTIHFISHSLGGILVRYYFSRNEFENMGRVVMLGPPNQGSRLADRFLEHSWFRQLTIPAGKQLGTGTGSVPKQLGAVNYSVGVVAGEKNLRPLLMRGVNNSGSAAGDGTVLVEETVVEGMSDFMRLPVTHTFMMWDQQVIKQAIYFLEAGAFTLR